jgi:hypothetical protein
MTTRPGSWTYKGKTLKRSRVENAFPPKGCPVKGPERGPEARTHRARDGVARQGRRSRRRGPGSGLGRTREGDGTGGGPDPAARVILYQHPLKKFPVPKIGFTL